MRQLLDAVRRHLWRSRFHLAARRAAWASAGTLALAAALHLARPVPGPGAWLALVAVVWTAALAWAAAGRPRDADCAAWADRRLGGASAYGTWLETRAGGGRPDPSEALRWLQRWAALRAPHCLAELDRVPPGAGLGRPLAALAVCAALAALVQALWTGPAPARPVVAGPLGASDRHASAQAPAPVAPALEPMSLQHEVTRVLRTARSDAGPGAGARTPTAGPSRDGDRAGVPPVPPVAADSPKVGAGPAAPATAVDPVAVPGAGGPRSPQGRAGGAGRDVGDSPDGRAAVGVSRGPGVPRAVPRSAAAGGATAAAPRRVDLDQAADPFAAAAAQPGPGSGGPTVVAAATPPTAAGGLSLSPTETTYVQAWMKANARRR